MTEFEHIEAAQLAMNWLIDGSLNTVTVTFAYIVAAYIAGAQLSKLAAIGMSTLYTLFILGPIGGILGATRNYVMTIKHYHEAYPGGWAFGDTPDLTVVTFMTVSPLILGWLGSLAYLHFYLRKGI